MRTARVSVLHTLTENCSDESDPAEAGSGLLFIVSELVDSDMLKDKDVYFRLLRPSEDTCWTHRVILLQQWHLMCT